MSGQRHSPPSSTRQNRRAGAEVPWLPHPFSMTWRDGAFLHWPIDPERLRPHVPDPLELETRDGRAWLSVVPFVLARAGVRGSPALTRLSFPELNLRTYVSVDGVSGLYFFSIDLDGPLLAPLAERVSGIPCFHARQRVGRVEDRIQFSSDRHTERESTATADPAGSADRAAPGAATFNAQYQPRGAASRAEPDSLAHWLTERRRMFVPRGQHVLVAEIAHEPWPLKRADVTIEENTLFEAAGLPVPRSDPDCYYCDRLEITGSVLRRLR